VALRSRSEAVLIIRFSVTWVMAVVALTTAF
jgi:hypothetical protein